MSRPRIHRLHENVQYAVLEPDRRCQHRLVGWLVTRLQEHNQPVDIANRGRSLVVVNFRRRKRARARRFRIRRLPSGPGIRNDIGIYDGWEVPVFYDSLLAKLAVWGESREQAVGRLGRALAEYSIDGVRTTLGLFRDIIADDDFRAGNLDTGFLDRFLKDRSRVRVAGDNPSLSDLAAVAAALQLAGQVATSRESSSTRQKGRWKYIGRQ